MADEALTRQLDRFRDEHNVTNKGNLSVVIQLTRLFSKVGVPIVVDDFVTKRGGQVRGLGGGNLKTILADHGITRTLAREGGRTSRGSMGLMEQYAAFMNTLPKPVDFEAIEDYWALQIKAYFASKPFRLEADPSKTVSACVDDLLAQAKRRQRENPGTMYEGTVLQDLVAAKLSLLMPGVVINGTSVADAPTGRSGDFMVGDVAVHCTTSTGQPLIEKCRANIDAGVRPVIVTLRERVTMARNLAEDAGISERVEVWDVQQFLSTNVNEHGSFASAGRRETMRRIVDAYNAIIDRHEDDPSLRIEFQ